MFVSFGVYVINLLENLYEILCAAKMQWTCQHYFEVYQKTLCINSMFVSFGVYVINLLENLYEILCAAKM